jgi:hypothetical protein
MPRKTKPETTRDTTAKRLKAFYAAHEPQGALVRVSRRLFKLAELAGLTDARTLKRSERHTIYTRAAAAGFADSPEAADLRRELADIEKWNRKYKKKKVDTPKPATAGNSYEITINFDACRLVGFLPGEIVEATEAHDLRVWDIAAVEEKEDEAFRVGRVVAISPEEITIRTDASEKTFTRAALAFEGRVKPEPVAHVDGMDVEQLKKWAVLKVKLANLDDDITDCTQRLKLEREIYDLEHPTGANDWSAWEEDDED